MAGSSNDKTSQEMKMTWQWYKKGCNPPAIDNFKLNASSALLLFSNSDTVVHKCRQPAGKTNQTEKWYIFRRNAPTYEL